MLVKLHVIRKKKCEGVVKSAVVGFNAAKQRLRFLSLGQPPLGRNGGNTPYNTHRVLQIIDRAKETKRNCGDGGWKADLSVCTHIYAHTHNNIYACTHTHTYMHVYICTHTRARMHTHIYICIHTYAHIHMHACIRIHMHMHVYICTHTHAHMHTHTYIYAHIHMHVYICTYP